MINFFHRFFNPHCEHCKEERLLERESNRCQNCDTLHELLNQEHAENHVLMEQIIKLTDPKIEVVQPEPVIIEKPKKVAWLNERARLEEEDRKRSQQIKENLENADKTTEELEREVGIV